MLIKLVNSSKLGGRHIFAIFLNIGSNETKYISLETAACNPGAQKEPLFDTRQLTF